MIDSARTCLRALTAVAAAAATAAVAMWGVGCETAGADAPPRLKKQSSMTILPVDVAGAPSVQVAEVVGMMLERGGMDRLELASSPFVPPKGADAATVAAAFAASVKETPPTTEQAMFIQLLGTPQTGVAEVRTIVVSRDGQILWLDALKPGDAAFDRAKPGDPLDCCRLVAARARPVFDLADPFREHGPPGRLAQAWMERTGLPQQAELDAMAERAERFRRAAPKATVAVYQPRSPRGVEASAQGLARAIEATKVVRTEAVPIEPPARRLEDMNEQKILWLLARDFSAYVRQHPPQAEYALLADYLGAPTPEGTVHFGAVHLVLCDREGNLVLVEHQNRRHPDYQAIAPASVADCDALAARRLKAFAQQ